MSAPSTITPTALPSLPLDEGHAVLAATIRGLPGIQPAAAEHMIGVYAAQGLPADVALVLAHAIQAQPRQMAWACNEEYRSTTPA